MRSVLAACAALCLWSSARAEVVGVSESGFRLKEVTHVAATPARVWATLVKPARWWSSDHTYSGDAANLTLDARAGGCWCEKLQGGGSVQHMTVVFALPGKSLRLRGALGPLQSMGVEGAMTWSLAAAGEGTDLTVTYAVGGYSDQGFLELSKGVDDVLSAQVARLRSVAEGGKAEGR